MPAAINFSILPSISAEGGTVLLTAWVSLLGLVRTSGNLRRSSYGAGGFTAAGGRDPAIAAMAMFGAGSASAVQLCKVELKTAEEACPTEPNQVYTGPIVAELQSEQQVLSSHANSIETSCQASKISGKTEGKDAQEAEGGNQQLLGEITSATWGECSSSSCPFGVTDTAVQLPWKVHLTQKEPLEANNGWMYVGEGGKGQPGINWVCKSLIGTIECEYKVEEAQPNHTGEWAWLEVIGGNPAKIKTRKAGQTQGVQLKLVRRTSSLCGEIARNQGDWEAEYDVTEPAFGLWVAHRP
jgi:hypothetical protein